MGDAHGADLTAFEHVDRAPVGELRHRELDELGQRVLQVERLAEDDAGLRQEGERFLALAVLGEVEEGGNRCDDLAARVAHGLGAERDDAVRPVGAHDLDLVGRRRLSLPAPGARARHAVPRSSAPMPRVPAVPARAGS